MLQSQDLKNLNLICLVDGEHYPPVTKWTIDELREKGNHIQALLILGGTEKVEDAQQELQDSRENDPYEVVMGHSSFEETLRLLKELIGKKEPDKVVDLSDEPVVGYWDRFKIASHVLSQEVDYVGADFHFKAPEREKILEKPSLGIIGTGKRVGKTAVSVSVARILKKNNLDPAIVAMGRGGPPEPELIRKGDTALTPEFLLETARGGAHAASDYWEDATLADVTTVGCRRCGGGMGGSPFVSNVREGAKLTNELDEKFVIMEGSGPTIPPVKTDSNLVVVGAGQPIEYVTRFLGEYRLLSSDLAIVTMCEKPIASKEKIQRLWEEIEEINPDIDLAFTVFRPDALGKIEGKKVYFTTTAQEKIAETIGKHLEKECGCEVIGVSSNLSKRDKLREDLEENLDQADVLLTEIKAASIDVAADMADKKDVEVIFAHNEAVLIDGTIKDLEQSILELVKNEKRQ